MKNDRWRVSVDVPMSTRTLLLRMFPPKFRKVYAHSITWAYGVSDSFEFSSARQDVVLYGYHKTDVTEALLASIGGVPYRADGNMPPLFLTLSVAEGLDPLTAGQINQDNVDHVFNPVTFSGRLTRRPLWQLKPDLNTRATA